MQKQLPNQIPHKDHGPNSIKITGMSTPNSSSQSNMNPRGTLGADISMLDDTRLLDDTRNIDVDDDDEFEMHR